MNPSMAWIQLMLSTDAVVAVRQVESKHAWIQCLPLNSWPAPGLAICLTASVQALQHHPCSPFLCAPADAHCSFLVHLAVAARQLPRLQATKEQLHTERNELQISLFACSRGACHAVCLHLDCLRFAEWLGEEGVSQHKGEAAQGAGWGEWGRPHRGRAG